ncbi:hypothetical protein sync_1127 [Synechococcus sp. CC9311]|nr:hypothetical protein sync_1127 [Synechococcus sp. CC9311]
MLRRLSLGRLASSISNAALPAIAHESVALMAVKKCRH